MISNKIIISLMQPETAPEKQLADWVRLDQQGARIETVVQGKLSELQPKEEDEVLVLIPAEDILLTQALLPKLNRYRLQQALPYALEEQVLDELENLHFACGSYQAHPNPAETNQLLPVAIIKKERIEYWLKQLQALNIQPSVLTSASFGLPFIESQWQLFVSEQRATLRTGLYTGFSADLCNLGTLLPLKLKEDALSLEKLIIYYEGKKAPELTALGAHTQLIEKPFIELALQALEQQPYLNLLQPPYHSQRKLKVAESNKKSWQFAGLALALWLGCFFIGKLGTLVILSYEHHHLQNIINHTYHAYFPEAHAVFNPKAKLEAKLKQAQAESEKNRFLQWLGYLAKASSFVRIQNLTFQNNQFNLEVLAPSYALLDEFILSLKAEGLNLKQQSAAMLGNQVTAVILIEGKTA